MLSALTCKPNDMTVRHGVSWRPLAFIIALLVYAGFSSPTPDTLGWPEAVVALGLAAVVMVPRLNILNVSALLFLLYGMSVPLISGVASGHDPAMIVRDLVPFSFLLLPLFFRRAIKDHQTAFTTLLMVMGFIFAARSLWPYRDAFLSPQTWLGKPPADLLYLANSPEVLFSALMLFGFGAGLIWARRAFWVGAGMMAASAIPVLAMAVMMQRAGLGCVVLAAGVWTAIGFWIKPLRTAAMAAVCLTLLLPLLPLAQQVGQALVYKTEMVGLNSRAQEWGTVLRLTGQSPWTMVFGLGWGTSFENPAVGNLPVNYTHSLISSIWLKTGLLGVAFLGFYLWNLAKQAVPDLLRRPILLLSILCPLGIGLIFYASYKSLGYGLLLLWLSLQGRQEKLEKNQMDMP